MSESFNHVSAGGVASSSSQQVPKPKKMIGVPLMLSILIHGALFILLGGIIVFEAPLSRGLFVDEGGGVIEEAEDVDLMIEDSPAAEPDIDMPDAMSYAETAPPIEIDLHASTITTSATPNFSVFAPSVSVLSASTMIGGKGSGGNGGSGGRSGLIGGGTGVSFFGMKSVAERTVIMIDISGSMVTGRRSRETFEKVVKEVEGTLRDLEGSSTFFELIVFAADADGYRGKWSKTSKEEINRAVKWLRREGPVAALRNGMKSAPEKYDWPSKFRGTRVDLALDGAFDLKPDLIFVLSDGDPIFRGERALKTGDGQSVNDAETLLKFVKERQSKLKKPAKIHTISFLAEGGKKFMQSLAAQNGGQFNDVR